MKSKAAYYLRDHEPLHTGHAPTWRRSKRARREIYTDLTDEDFQESGLRVISRIDPDAMLSSGSGPSGQSAKVQSWLVQGSANDDASMGGVLSWIEVVKGRIDSLRSIAEDEGLDFNEESAAAALSFVSALSEGRQPGTFLVGGNIRFLWDLPSGEEIGLQFRGSGNIQFVILSFGPDGLQPMMGIRSHETVMATIKAAETRHIFQK